MFRSEIQPKIIDYSTMESQLGSSQVYFLQAPNYILLSDWFYTGYRTRPIDRSRAKGSDDELKDEKSSTQVEELVTLV